MKLPIVQIGNSKGLRLPKSLIEQLHFTDEVELEVRADELAIKAIPTVRKDWDIAFQTLHAKADDLLLDQNLATDWDKTEWEW